MAVEMDDLVLAYSVTKNKIFLNTILTFMDHEEVEKDEAICKRNWTRINLSSMSDIVCCQQFRFNKTDLTRLKAALEIPDVIHTADRSVFDGEEALCVLLRRLAYPNRLCDLEDMFGRGPTQLSIIFNFMLRHVENNFGFLTDSLNLFWLEDEYLQHYAQAIREKGAPLNNCVGFIDGTLRPMCRPEGVQNTAYNGHKRQHGIKFQSVVAPNGLIMNLFGPIEGCRHDSFMLSCSQLLEKLKDKFHRGDNIDPYCLYGDPAYPNRPELIAPFKGTLEPYQEAFNKAMSSVRQSVEWEFGKILTYFAFCDFKKNLKLNLQAVSRYYKVAAILSNCHTCINGSKTSSYFNVNPPTLEQYLANVQ